MLVCFLSLSRSRFSARSFLLAAGTTFDTDDVDDGSILLPHCLQIVAFVETSFADGFVSW